MIYSCIGLTGLPYAGKTTVAKILENRFGYTRLSYSQILEEGCKARGWPLCREYLTKVAEELRKDNEPPVLARLALQKHGKTRKLTFPQKSTNVVNKVYTLSTIKNLVVDAIRHPIEIDFYKKECQNFLMIAIDSDSNIRYKRMTAMKRDIDTKTDVEEFRKRDYIEWNATSELIDVKKCFELADVIVKNTRSLEELDSKIEEIIEECVLRN